MQELLDAHGDVEPIQNVLGSRVHKRAELTNCVPAVTQERDVLSREEALRLEHGAQPPLRFAVYPMNKGEDLGYTFLRDALSGDHLEASVGTR